MYGRPLHRPPSLCPPLPRPLGLLGTLRAARSMPLSERDVRMWQTVVPNMTRWLPEAEAETIRSTFHREMERLGA